MIMIFFFIMFSDDYIYIYISIIINPNIVSSFHQNKIGQTIAHELVTDGSCLQMGIGGIPDAVLSSLSHHKDLSIHTEMLSSGLLSLVSKGVVTNRLKPYVPDHVVATFCSGSQELYDYLNDNPMIEMLTCDKTNSTAVIMSIPK